ncbi:MAG: hypothetical protein Q7U02_04565 [Desulfosalsimonadaceae bacterium]|nr:hypothetical protein [Desulfosalsimonadaceae bacterium]
MKINSRNFSLSLTIAAILLTALIRPQPTLAQEEVAAGLRRFDSFMESGYYEEHEVRPRNQRPNVAIPGVRRDIFPYSPTASEVRIRTRLADSHLGLKFYERRQCWDCHPNEAMNNHSTNAGITCRQCHGGEPVAGIYHYYSPLNPIRRHAYVCAKCHEGAGASFATYLIHEPPAGAKDTKTSFPGLYYVSWFMVILLVGTLGFFVPHTHLLGLRELMKRKRTHTP